MEYLKRISMNKRLLLSAAFIFFISFMGVAQENKFEREINQILSQNLTYSATIRQTGIQGIVLISAKIDELGKIDSLFLIESPDDRLTDVVINAMRALQDKWKTKYLDGRPFDKKYLFHFSFQIGKKTHDIVWERKQVEKLLEKGDDEKALEKLNELIAGDQYSYLLFELRATANRQLGNIEASQEDYIRAKYLKRDLISTITITAIAQ
ncbi:hypothetical protein J2X69_002174 [Algoriphagus sp. 4150]|uniref:energy transducer TonB n=1 Tax=Algoriphagus sp. 4150 TaxID=2817756 RepID=UPI0028554C2C|nr:energy transducer TonB [Algoriphagus sp. 4150]MDR7129828.1 hypothetical protein [Algoriphagus sp. 4150]